MSSSQVAMFGDDKENFQNVVFDVFIARTFLFDPYFTCSEKAVIDTLLRFTF